MDYLQALLSFLAILNPFALCLYLVGVMDDLYWRSFARVLLVSTGISLVVFLLFAFYGNTLLEKLLQIEPEAMRAFGGVVFFVIAYQYVTHGHRTMNLLRGGLQDLPSEIALPFMIGGGTITQAILIGEEREAGPATAIIVAGMAVTYLVVLAFKLIRDRVHTRYESVFERYVGTLARLNGLLIGAISTEMIVTGVRDLWNGA